MREYIGKYIFDTRNDKDRDIIYGEVVDNIYRIPDGIKTVIDIGAHLGGTSMVCAGKGAMVYAYEPEESNYNLLVDNVNANYYQDKIKCFKLGVSGRKKSEAILSIHPTNSGCHNLYGKNDCTTGVFQTIQLVSLRNVFKDTRIRHCSLLKMDCEGAELDILYHVPNFLLSRIDMIVTENHWDIYGEKGTKKILDRLDPLFETSIHDHKLIFAYRK